MERLSWGKFARQFTKLPPCAISAKWLAEPKLGERRLDSRTESHQPPPELRTWFELDLRADHSRKKVIPWTTVVKARTQATVLKPELRSRGTNY
jgi:hypothetical protein